MKVMATAMLSAFAFAASAQVVSSVPENSVQQQSATSVITSNTQPQQTSALTNTQLSEQYKLQINVINNELKTLKAQAKLYKTDAVKSAEIATLTATKKTELADVKAKKKIADQAVKTEKQSKKAAEKAEKARKKAQDAAEKAAMLQK